MRTDRVLTRVLSGVAGSALMLTLAACGGDATTTEEPAATDASSASSADASTEETEPSEPSEPADEDEATGGGQTMSGTGDVSYAGDDTAMRMSMQIPQLGSGSIEMRMLDGVMYMSMPPMTPKGKFIKIDTKDPNSPLGDLGGVTQGDPLATFDAFDAGLQDVEYVGPEDVDGEQMDHYVLTVDAAKAAKAQGQQVQPGMPETISYDMWIDEQDLMRRIEFDLGAVAGGGAGGMVMTMSDWGKPVTVEAPPANAIVQMPGMPAR